MVIQETVQTARGYTTEALRKLWLEDFLNHIEGLSLSHYVPPCPVRNESRQAALDHTPEMLTSASLTLTEEVQ
jgi:hypothetical protein